MVGTGGRGADAIVIPILQRREEAERHSLRPRGMRSVEPGRGPRGSLPKTLYLHVGGTREVHGSCPCGFRVVLASATMDCSRLFLHLIGRVSHRLYFVVSAVFPHSVIRGCVHAAVRGRARPSPLLGGVPPAVTHRSFTRSTVGTGSYEVLGF